MQASTSLQTAARSVIRENIRLRSLLRQRGVKDTEVEAYLKDNTHDSDDRASDGLSARSIMPSFTRSICTKEQSTASSSITSHQKSVMESSQRDSASKDQSSQSAAVSNAPGKMDRPQSSTCLIIKEDQPIESQRLPSQEHTVRYQSPIERHETGKVTRDNMTPCMEAAMIIVGMNGGLSTDEAKAELGCPPLNDCYVDNLTVFRVMDR